MALDLREIKPCMLIYDIPEHAPEGCERIPNPSRRLRTVGIRLQYSCWVVPEKQIPYAHLNWMSDNGATWHAVPYDTAAADVILKVMQESVVGDLYKAICSAEKTIETAARLVAEEELSEHEAHVRVRRARRRIGRLTEDLRTSLRAFGIDPKDLPLTDQLHKAIKRLGLDPELTAMDVALQASELLQGRYATRARVYARTAARLKATQQREAATIAAGILADDVPVNVAGDALIEATGDLEAADELLQAFREPELVA